MKLRYLLSTLLFYFGICSQVSAHDTSDTETRLFLGASEIRLTYPGLSRKLVVLFACEPKTVPTIANLAHLQELRDTVGKVIAAMGGPSPTQRNWQSGIIDILHRVKVSMGKRSHSGGYNPTLTGVGREVQDLELLLGELARLMWLSYGAPHIPYFYDSLVKIFAYEAGLSDEAKGFRNKGLTEGFNTVQFIETTPAGRAHLRPLPVAAGRIEFRAMVRDRTRANNDSNPYLLEGHLLDPTPFGWNFESIGSGELTESAAFDNRRQEIILIQIRVVP